MAKTAVLATKPQAAKTATQVKTELRQEIKQIQASIKLQSASTRAHLTGRFRAN